MGFVCFDTEADGFVPKATKVHCLGVMWGDEVRVTNNPEDYKRFFAMKDTYFVCHNIFDYDLPLFRKLFPDIDLPIDRFICSLGLSYALFPKRGSHGLAGWGKTFGIDKPNVEDWSDQPYEVYVNRVTEDVKIQQKVWDAQWSLLMELYDNDQDKALRYIKYINLKMQQLADQQHVSKVPVDKSVVQRNLDKFLALQKEKWDELIKVAPPKEIKVTRQKPKVTHKQDGTLSVHGENWLELAGSFDIEEIEEVVGQEPFNPNSTEQTKAWLFSLGWEPCTYEQRKAKGGVNSVPQITDKEGNLTPSVKRLLEKEPALELLEGLGIIKHRLGLLKGLLECEEDGYVISGASKFTKTLRLAHKKPIANLPKVATKEGEKGGIQDGAFIRGCIVAKDGNMICGSDMSSLEARMKQHFIYHLDPDYVHDMMVEGFDEHWDLAVSAGAISQEQVEANKRGDANNKDIRHIYKTANYTLQFGAGIPKLASTIGRSKAEARAIHQAYWKRNWAVKSCVKGAKIKTVGKDNWLLNPINGYYYYLSNEKDVFSSWCQSGGAYVVDVWIYFMRKAGLTPALSYHDEVLLEIPHNKKQETEKLLLWAIEQTNKSVHLNRGLAIDIQFGADYSSVH